MFFAIFVNKHHDCYEVRVVFRPYTAKQRGTP